MGGFNTCQVMEVVEALPTIHDLAETVTTVLLVTAIVTLLGQHTARVFFFPVWFVIGNGCRARLKDWVLRPWCRHNVVSDRDCLSRCGILVRDESIINAVTTAISSFLGVGVSWELKVLLISDIDGNAVYCATKGKIVVHLRIAERGDPTSNVTSIFCVDVASIRHAIKGPLT